MCSPHGFGPQVAFLTRISIQQLLIEWKEGGSKGATWEDEGTIKDQFPDFNRVDKVVQVPGSIDRTLKVYVGVKSVLFSLN